MDIMTDKRYKKSNLLVVLKTNLYLIYFYFIIMVFHEKKKQLQFVKSIIFQKLLERY